MRKLVFSSDALPARVDDNARFKLWRDMYEANFGPCDQHYSDTRPFSARYEFVQFGAVAVTRHAVMLTHYARTSRHVAADARSDFLIGFNRAQSNPTLFQRERELTLAAGQIALFTNAEPAEARACADMALVGLALPRALLLERLSDADDLALAPVDAASPAARHLRRYLEFLLEPDEIEDHPALAAHIETTLIDLAALALGAAGEAAEIAQLRGLRAARLREILTQIAADFDKPGFSIGRLASKLGLSERYVQDLLQETGSSLSERVLELRLRKARAMLCDLRHDRLKVSEIAYACGFNEASYFNRCFRRRFGASPTQYRGRHDGTSYD